MGTSMRPHLMMRLHIVRVQGAFFAAAFFFAAVFFFAAGRFFVAVFFRVFVLGMRRSRGKIRTQRLGEEELLLSLYDDSGAAHVVGGSRFVPDRCDAVSWDPR